EFLVAHLDLDHRLQPFRHRQGMPGLLSFPEAVMRRVEPLFAIRDRVEQAGVPSLARLKRDLEAEPPIGGNGLARCTRHADCHRPLKIPVRIDGTKSLPSLRPFSGNLASTYDVARLHLKDVSKITSQRDFELKTHRLHAVVGDVEIFVQAADDRSTDREANGALRDGAVLGENGFVGEKDACGMIVDGAAVQELPRFAIGVNCPVADNSRVEKVEALLARPADLPVWLADEHRLTLVDGDLWRADMNFKRHDASSYARPVYRKAVLSFPQKGAPSEPCSPLISAIITALECP